MVPALSLAYNAGRKTHISYAPCQNKNTQTVIDKRAR